MLKPLALILNLILAQYSFSQVGKSYPFAHYNLNNGLAAYNANSVVQDKEGFIWIGTINGLQRFDGHRFLTFRRIPGDIRTISDNYIDQMIYDRNGNLWLVLGNGQVGTFNTRNYRFDPVQINARDERTLKLARRLIEDSDGNLLYVIFAHEIMTYDTKKKAFSAEYNRLRIPSNWKVTSFAEDPLTKRYWMATDSGMCVFNKQTKFLSYRGHNNERIKFIDRFPGNIAFEHLTIDSNALFWYTTKQNASAPLIHCYDLKNDSLLMHDVRLSSVMNKQYDVKKFLRQRNGQIWIGGVNVFMKYDTAKRQFEQATDPSAEKHIDYQEINCLYEDNENNIWLSTNNNGVYVIRSTKNLFSSIKHSNRASGKIEESAVISLLHNNKNEILAAVNSGGLYIYDQQLNERPSSVFNNRDEAAHSIWSICRLKDNRTYWMGLQSGIMIYDQLSGTSKIIQPQLFQNKLVRSIAEDKQGNIWLAVPSGGLFKWSLDAAKGNLESGFRKVNNTPGTLIEKVTVDEKGLVWVATLMNGVYKIDPRNDSILEHLTTKGPPSKRLLADAATDVFHYNDSIVIIPTGALNIYNTKSNTITHITSADGLPSDIVRSIEKDSKNYLWLGLFNGLCRMNLEKKTFTYYDRNDGMSNDNFNYSSSCHLPDGRLVFGTTTDFVVFDPKDLNITTRPPNVSITDFRLINKPLSIDSLAKLKKIEFGPDQNILSIGFSGLSFRNNKWSYYYMLEGLEKEWKKADESNQVNYNFIPAGTYTFKVKAQDADGVSSEEIALLEFQVNPPIFKSWWFYSMCALLGALILFLLDRERMKRKQAMEKMRSDIADNLHQEVNTALNKINIMSEMARLKAAKDPGKSVEYFEQIHKKSHDMIIAMDDMLWSINPENDSMSKTVDRIKEYIDAMRNRYGVNIDLLVDKRVETLVINMKLRHDLFVMMKEGIKSVIEAGSRNCKVHMSMEKEGLVYTIEIDNECCDLQLLNNQVQQIDLERRLGAMNATLTSSMHKYTSRFELKVPVI